MYACPNSCLAGNRSVVCFAIQPKLKDGRRVGVEFKRADAPTLTPSMRIAIQDLGPDALYVVYPGTRRYALAQGVGGAGLGGVLQRVCALGCRP